MSNMQELLERKDKAHSEYQKACREIVELQLKELIDQFKDEIPNEPKSMCIDFNWEWNDEDGTDPHVGSITVYDKNDDIIELEEHTIMKKPSWSDNEYEYTLDEYIRDMIYETFDLRELLDAFDTKYELEIELI